MSSKNKTAAAKEVVKPALVPKLRFLEFRGVALRSVQLGDVTEEGRRRNGKKHSVASVMGVTKADGIVPMEARLIAADIERYKLVEQDWFAYNPMRLNIGSIARWKGDSEILVSPDYVVFKCITGGESGIAAGYLDHFRQTKAWENFVIEGGDGGVRVRIYYKDIARLQLSLPSLPEQQRIAECLSSLDELMAAQSRKVYALKTHKKGLMQQLFPREGETQPRLRFPEFQNAGEWSVRTIGDMFRLINGRAFKPEDWKPSGTPIIRIQNLNDPSAEFNYSQAPVPERNRIESGDLLFAWSGTLGSSFGARVWNGPPGVLNQHIFKVLMDEQQTTLPFSLLVLARVEEDIAKKSHGFKASFVHVKKSDLVKVDLPLPSLPEQQRIASCLGSLDALITAETQKLEALKAHKKGLMQQLFPSPEAVEA